MQQHIVSAGHVDPNPLDLAYEQFTGLTWLQSNVFSPFLSAKHVWALSGVWGGFGRPTGRSEAKARQRGRGKNGKRLVVGNCSLSFAL